MQYPGSDPWVLACGGTTIGNVVGASCDEWAWDDVTGASGGGVSDYFPQPSYQIDANVPRLDKRRASRARRAGRGGQRQPNSGYPFILNGVSALAPTAPALPRRSGPG